MREGIKVGQKVYYAGMRDGVVVSEATVTGMDGPLMRVVVDDDDRVVWTAHSGMTATWTPTRRAALEWLRDGSRRNVERVEQTLEEARHELTLVEAALEEVGDA